MARSRVPGILANGVVLDRQVGPGHLWVAYAVFLLDEPTLIAGGKIDLNPQRLIQVTDPSCHVCDVQWSPELAGTICPGRSQ